MPESDMGKIWSMTMVMFGDLFTIMTLIGSVLLLLGIIIDSRNLAVRGGGAGILALIVTIVAFMQKIANPETASFENGFIFGFSDGLVMILLGVAILLCLASFGLIVLRRVA